MADDVAEWTVSAFGPNKRRLSVDLILKLRDRFACELGGFFRMFPHGGNNSEFIDSLPNVFTIHSGNSFRSN